MTQRRRRQQQNWRRHGDDIHDKDVVGLNQPIILLQVFFQAPNTFKPVCHLGAMNNTSSTVLNFQKRGLQHAFMSQNQSFISIIFLPLYFRNFSQNSSCIVFYHYISVHYSKSFISKSFLTLYFSTLSQNPSFISISFHHYISVRSTITRIKAGRPC